MGDSIKSESLRLNLRFVLRNIHANEDECSNDMKLAFKACKELDEALCPSWITEDSSLPAELTKRDVYVFEIFEGKMFNDLCKSKSVILGPRTLLSCFSEDVPIPSEVSAIFTIAMNKLIIASTNFEKPEREEIAKKIGYMGGFYSQHILKGTTHLVARSIISNKCEIARQMGITVVTAEWVEAVWEASKVKNVKATDPEFDVYKCPIFHGLVISCTGLHRSEKEKLKIMIDKNGGELKGVLESAITKILIVNSTKSEKFKAAVNWKVPCVTPSWVYDSEKCGYALDVTDYLVDKNQFVAKERKCSTPVLDDSALLHDFSTISSIQADESMLVKTHVNETAVNETTASSNNKHRSNKHTDWASKYSEVVNMLDIREAKKAGNFLDGCNVYLSGFPTDMMEKLRRVLNNGGATRFNEISSRVSHIIAGEFLSSDMKALKSCANRPHVVRVDWLVESIKLRCPAPVEQFSCFDSQPPATEPPSPSLKKGVRLLQPELVPVPFLLNAFDEKEDEQAKADSQSNLIPQYMNKDETFYDLGGRNLYDKVQTADAVAVAIPEANTQGGHTMTYTEIDTQTSVMFAGLKFVVVGFDDDDEGRCEEMIEKGGGEVVRRGFKGVPNYGVVPFDGALLRHTTDEVVTSIWLDDCYLMFERVPVQYYHQPVALPSKPHILVGCVIGMSSYVGKEREFLSSLAESLGAISQEVFARRDNKAKNAVASTHLVCKEPGSQKYTAAIKWRLPAVTHEWLLACLRQGKRVSENDYRVTASSGEESFEKSSSATGSTNLRRTKDDPIQEVAIKVSTENFNKAIPLETFDDCATHSSSINDSATKKMADATTVALQCSVDPLVENLDIANFNKNLLKDTAEVSTNELKENVPMGPPTPVNVVRQHYGFSQETPIHVTKRRKISTPACTPDNENASTSVGISDADTSYRPAVISTPETPYGIGENPSPETRKRWIQWIKTVPEFDKDVEVLKKQRRDSTPLAELYRKCWNNLTDLPNGVDAGADAHSVSTDANAVEESNDVTPRRTRATVVPYAQQMLNDDKSLELPAAVAPAVANLRSEGGVNTQLNQLNALLLSSPNVDGKALEEGNKLTMRRPSIMETPSSASSPTIVNMSSENKSIETAIKESQSDVIAWADHSRNNTKEAITASAVVTNVTQTEVKTKAQLRFMLSSIDNRETYEQMIISLGGSVSEQSNFDAEATHLVTTRPARSEKLLASIASGKWILSKNYLDDSYKQGHFLAEEFYEWGNPTAEEAGHLMALKRDSMDSKLASAAYRWRKRLQGGAKGGAFKGIRAIVLSAAERIPALTRLIQAGGGSIENASLPFNNPGTATHCFLELNKISAKVDIPALVEKNVLCLPPIFLNNYLIADQPLDAELYVIPEYKELLLERHKR